MFLQGVRSHKAKEQKHHLPQVFPTLRIRPKNALNLFAVCTHCKLLHFLEQHMTPLEQLCGKHADLSPAH